MNTIGMIYQTGRCEFCGEEGVEIYLIRGLDTWVCEYCLDLTKEGIKHATGEGGLK